MGGMCREMRKLRRGLGFAIVAAAMTLLAAVPAGALAAGGESGGSSTPAGTATESPGSSAEPAAPAGSPPSSTGWVPEGTGTETSSEGAAEAQRGSSLGSGGAPKQGGSTSEGQGGASRGEQGGPSGGESSYTGSSDYYEPYEPKSSPPPAVEPPPNTPRAVVTHSVRSPAPTGRAAVGAATPLKLSASPQAANASSAPSAAVAPSTASGDRAASGSGAVPVWLVIVCGLALACVGSLGVHRWRRRRHEERLAALWERRKANWEAAISQVRLEPTSEASEQSGERLQRVGGGSASVPRPVQADGARSQSLARARGKPARVR
jgi:hypothetical protein